MVNLRISETLQAGAVRKPLLPFSYLVGAVSKLRRFNPLFSSLVGAVSNCADAVRFPTAPTGPDN